MLVSVYSGCISIGDTDFYLTVDQFIVIGSEYSLVFSGVDQVTPFKIEGVATKSTEGVYMASELKINYLREADTVSIRLDTVKLSPNKNKCLMKGVWIQGGESWGFSTNLRLLNDFKAKIQYDVERDSFTGKILGLSKESYYSSVYFFGKTSSELRNNFKEAVESMMEADREKGILCGESTYYS